jgi:UDP-glucose 4-epimerase
METQKKQLPKKRWRSLIAFYSISKLRAEQHVRRLAEKMNTIIVRLGNVYGYSKSMRFDAVINRFMFDAHFTHRITVNGSGHQHRSFIHIDKTTDILSQLICKNIPGDTYNLADKTLSILDIIEVMRTSTPILSRSLSIKTTPVITWR